MNKKRILVFICGVISILFIYFGLNLLNMHQEDYELYEPSLYIADVETSNPFYAYSPSTVYCNTGALVSGVYKVTISYKTEGEAFFVSCKTEKTDGYKYPVIYADSHQLNPSQEEITFTIWVNGNIDELEVDFRWEEDELYNDSLYIERIALTRDYRQSVLYGAVKILVVFCAFCAGAWTVWHWERVKIGIKRNFWVIFGLVSIFIVSSLGVFNLFQTSGHDFPFHCARIAGLAEGLKTGNFPVKMQPGWNNGYGYPVSVYYGDVFLYVPAFLCLLSVPIVYAYKVYVLMVNLSKVLISFFAFKKISSDKLAGVTCSALYCLSVNYILNLYLRSAVGEYTASIFFR